MIYVYLSLTSVQSQENHKKQQFLHLSTVSEICATGLAPLTTITFEMEDNDWIFTYHPTHRPINKPCPNSRKPMKFYVLAESTSETAYAKAKLSKQVCRGYFRVVFYHAADVFLSFTLFVFVYSHHWHCFSCPEKAAFPRKTQIS